MKYELRALQTPTYARYRLNGNPPLNNELGGKYPRDHFREYIGVCQIVNREIRNHQLPLLSLGFMVEFVYIA